MFPDVTILLGSPLKEVFQLWIEELLPLQEVLVDPPGNAARTNWLLWQALPVM